MPDTRSERAPSEPDDDALDTYSQVVTRIAAELTPRVAALQMSRRRRDGRVEASAGSAVVFTDDGFLLTNAHVVGRNTSGTAAFADGTTARSTSSVPTRSLISRSSEPMDQRRPRPSSAARPICESVNSSSRSAIRSDWPAV